jgi:Membrane domain of glycerophosphoryl diester phosphodiesterase
MAVLVLLVLPGITLTGSGGPPANAAVGATLLLLVVAGLTVGVRLAASIPAVVVEGRSWRHALSRSWSLVGGHWGHVLATLVLAFVAISLIGTLINVFIGSLVGMLAGDDWLARTLVQAAVNALTLAYFLTVGCCSTWTCGPARNPWTSTPSGPTFGRWRRDGRHHPAALRHLDLVAPGHSSGWQSRCSASPSGRCCSRT